MNITGPIQPNTSLAPEKNDLFLRVNQRVAGEILNVSNDQVVLSINGVQVVAQMTSSEQLAMLLERRFANFIVKDIGENALTLKLANLDVPGSVKQSSSQKLDSALLEQLGFPVDMENLMITQAALGRGMKITPELINEMRAILTKNGGWGSKEAQLAAAIKSAGLPLSVGSLSLALSAIKDMRSAYSALLGQLETAVNRSGASDGMGTLIRAAIDSLKEVLIQGGDSASAIEKNLIASVKNLGISLENEIGRLLQPELKESAVGKMANAILTLANLQSELGANANGKLGQAINNFIDGMRWMHFLNAETDHLLGKGQWSQLDLPINFGIQTSHNPQADHLHNLKIRVAHENENSSGAAINSEYTRLVVQVDLNEFEAIKVDLSIVSRQIGAEITASSEALCLTASEGLSEFQAGLSNLGYTLKTSRVELGDSILEMDLDESKVPLHSFSSVDLGV